MRDALHRGGSGICADFCTTRFELFPGLRRFEWGRPPGLQPTPRSARPLFRNAAIARPGGRAQTMPSAPQRSGAATKSGRVFRCAREADCKSAAGYNPAPHANRRGLRRNGAVELHGSIAETKPRRIFHWPREADWQSAAGCQPAVQNRRGLGRFCTVVIHTSTAATKCGAVFVGQTPWSAADPLVGFVRVLRMPRQRDQGVARRPGGLPYKNRRWAPRSGSVLLWRACLERAADFQSASRPVPHRRPGRLKIDRRLQACPTFSREESYPRVRRSL